MTHPRPKTRNPPTTSKSKESDHQARPQPALKAPPHRPRRATPATSRAQRPTPHRDASAKTNAPIQDSPTRPQNRAPPKAQTLSLGSTRSFRAFPSDSPPQTTPDTQIYAPRAGEFLQDYSANCSYLSAYRSKSAFMQPRKPDRKSVV